MKNTIIYIILITIFISPVNASEITGSISTNPHSLESDAIDNVINSSNTVEADHASPQGINNNFVLFKNNKKEKNNQKQDNVLVLGFSEYVDGSLLRENKREIYLIKGDFKKHIKSLEELQKYSGKIIFDVDVEILVKYKARDYLDDDLIRGMGDVKIFHVVNGELEHVLNLEELRINFSGQEIFNVAQKEILFYF